MALPPRTMTGLAPLLQNRRDVPGEGRNRTGIRGGADGHGERDHENRERLHVSLSVSLSTPSGRLPRDREA